MSTKILVKRSSTTGAIPTLAQLSVGELAINTADKRVFTNNGTAIVELGTAPSTQAVAGNATVGGTLGVTGATTLDDGTITGDFTVTGSLTVPAPTATGHAATKNYVDTAVANVLDSAPDLLNTLNELAAALGDDENFATNVYNAIALKLNKAGDTMTGTLDMGANKVTTTLNPTTDNELTRKGYVDGILGSATAAATSAANAATSEANAATSETNAASSATSAASSASGAANSATNAATSETNAATSASSASTSATQAATSATAAGTSETNAATSATNAATSETNAATSETNAATSATAASGSATAAASSATSAATSATTATTKASEASTSATNAATSETNAASSATAAASSATAAASDAATVAGIYDSFDDRYLGSKASAPTLDNDGNALLNGALYWNSTDTTMYVWGGSSWTAVGGTPETLQSIGASIADTAVDVFVYDTRKDSDGGAWRKRTQHTSWYNETLNTATRGARREFPAVAVIVANGSPNYDVTIYDGDDPDLPMWMVFDNYNNRPTGRAIGTGDNGTPTVGGIVMLNGELCVGTRGSTGSAGSWDGLFRIDFISEELRHHSINSTYSIYNGNVATRNNSSYGYTNAGVIGNYTSVSTQINDVAMTVLPNAPIDDATGLPIPTIAVATDGGVSVIKDDGSVVDLTSSSGGSYNFSKHIIFTEDNRLRFDLDSSGRYYRTLEIPSADTSVNQWSPTGDDGITIGNSLATADFAYIDGINPVRAVAPNAIGTDRGLLKFKEESPVSASLINYITDTYNTGWMNGDIKLATLSDTDATNVTGTELVTNGTFDTDTSGWTVGGTGASIASVSGELELTQTAGQTGYARQSFAVTAGKRYTVTVDLKKGTSNSVNFYLGSTLGGFEYWTQSHTTTTKTSYSKTIVAGGNTLYLQTINNVSSGGTGYYDNVSVRLAEEDRSVNGNGLQVFGTVTKTPVATGADLVAYSGFSAGNYLRQPYNSDLGFGTGDFCVMGWFNTTSNSQTYLSTGQATGFKLVDVGGQFRFYASNGFSYYSGAFGGTGWAHVVCVRRNGSLEIYKNGSKQPIVYNSNASGSVAAGSLVLGEDGVSFEGSMSLIRISATAPTAEQIAKIYEDEKVLFQEGAQATLYGSSDAVTALAYDDTTDLLHVGTSAGRSDFSGLRRVDNTTDAVGVALSASNGMIVEE